MADIKLIALDLDGTLLDSKKQLPEENAAALTRAAQAGICIVPSTGRFYGGMPEAVRALPFVRYVITINGAQVFDAQTGTGIYQAEMSNDRAVEIMRFLDTKDVIYDCYKDNWGFMTAALQEKTAEYAPNPHYYRMIKDLRRPVPELKAYLQEVGGGVQKVQVFCKNQAVRDVISDELRRRFDGIAVSSSLPTNIEINDERANKGDALLALAAHLGIPREQTMAFGDGSNDIPMLKAAGIGVCMANGCEESLAAADRVTVTNDEFGVARVIDEILGSA